MVYMCLPFHMTELDAVPSTRRTIELHTQEQLRAVSNLTRHDLIARLRDGEASTNGIAQALKIQKGSASYHLRLLERAGIVEVTRSQKVRGVFERFYSLAAERLVWPDPLPGVASGVLRGVIRDIEAVPASSDQLVGRRRARIGVERYEEFSRKLLKLIEEFAPDGDSDALSAQMTVVLFRDGRKVDDPED
jgi:DNA-binding transcriptional ArsR family regulator